VRLIERIKKSFESERCKHGNPMLSFCVPCIDEAGERIDREEREARIAEIEEGVLRAMRRYALEVPR
jgi:hypothetical protein